jgi:signal transduction histidine kinase
MSFWQTLTGRLFRLVFGWYLALAITVTSVQLGLEYATINDDIAANLKALGQSFAPSVADALWTIDHPHLDALATGMARATYVTGVSIADDRGRRVASAGEIPADDLSAQGMFAAYRFDAMPLQFRTPRGEEKQLGWLVLYSDREVAIERVKYSFFVIITNSLIKTAGLWLIFYLVITRLLARPLATLTSAVSRIEFAAEGDERVAGDYPHQDELGRLLQAMDKMQDRIAAAQQLVAERNRELAVALATAESANRLKSTFLANVSHELRTPLNLILGYAQILALDEDLGDEPRQSAREIEISGRQLLNLINDIIDVSRIESGEAARVATTYDLQEMLMSVAGSVSGMAVGRGAAVSVAFGAGVPRLVIGDAKLLRQAVTNLLSAAIKRSGTEAVGLVVAGTSRAAEFWLELSVDLPAAGLGTNDLEHLFQAFAVSRMGTQASLGTGLELVLAWEYAQLLDGTVTASMSASDRVSFCLALPMQVADRR